MSFLLLLFVLEAQTYTQEPAEFLKEMEKLFLDQDKKEGKSFIENEFTPFWNGPLTDQDRKEIYTLADGFAKLRLRAFPDYASMYRSLIGLTGDESNLSAWKETMAVLMKGRKNKLQTFNQVMEAYITDAVLLSKSTLEWKVRGNGTFELKGGKEPSLELLDVDLICLAKRDSSVVRATNGVYRILSEKWIGSGGIVDWQRAGLSDKETYAELSNYEIALKSPDFKADSTRFYNPFFSDPLLGRLTEKVLVVKDQESVSYPLFESFEQRLLIRDIAENMDYEGGFSMKGRRLIGTGTSEQLAKITVYRDDTPFIVSRGRVFVIRPDRIASENVAVSIVLSEDSIYHPSVKFRFAKDKKQITLVRGEEGLSKGPFYNSYHDLDMYFEALYWKLDDPSMDLGNLFGSSNTKAAFESKDYYKERRYAALQGIDPIHPLVRVRDLVNKVGSGFYVDDFARFTRLPEADAKKQLIIMANQGFLDYDYETEWIVVRPKLDDYVMNRAGKRDYDILLFNSDGEGEPNASLDLINYDLLLKGVSKIALSDSQRVNIYPDGKMLTLKKDRDFLFSGVTLAGNLELFGTDCRFDYEEFKVDFAQIDSVRLNVVQFEESRDKRLVKVKNALEGGKGVLSIDHPMNKSGQNSKDFPQYPEFTSLEQSFVYYDDQAIQNGSYEREDFFYRVEPYSLDSLDNFVANNIRLEGTLISGIFPNIEKPLTVQPDYSLGFEMSTGSEGLDAYGGKTRFTDRIKLDYNGLSGDGSIDYLTTHAEGEEFIFLPDSTTGTTTSYVNREQTAGLIVPQASAEQVDLAFIPDQDLLRIESLDQMVDAFNGQAAIDGTLELRPDGMTGSGLMDIVNAELSSRAFEFTDHDVFADTSEFRLKGQTADFGFKTEDVNAHVDFVERIGEFKANGEASYVDFPANQYVCFMDKFIWYMDQNDLALEYDGEVSNDFVIDTDLDLTKSNFFSTREDQDSLNFMAPKAVYDIDQSVITCNEIEFIRVADSRIIPDSGSVVIRKRAKMDPLEDAIIKTNFITQYHTIRDANVEIRSRRDYVGAGEYTYVDETGGEQYFDFGDIRVDSSFQTVASGTIAPSADFTLSPAFQYSGDVELFANQKGLIFKGQTRIFHDCEVDKNWMYFESEVDPEEVFIPVDTSLKDDIGLPVGVGLFMDVEEDELYSTFLSGLRFNDDPPVLTSSGVLTFDKNEDSYLVGPQDKLRERNLQGGLVSLSVKDCNIRGEGLMDLTMDMGQVDIRTVGSFVNDTKENSFDFNVMITLDFLFSDDALKKMGADLKSFPNLKPLNFQTAPYMSGIKEIVGIEEADKVISQLTLSGSVKKLPEELESTLVIADVNLKWDPILGSYVSEGPIGLANVGKNEVFAELKGIIQLEKRRTGDAMYIYLELDEDNWYFFNYGRTLMQAYSSNTEFNDIVLGTKEDARESKGQKGEDPYTFMLASKRKVENFLDDIGYK